MNHSLEPAFIKRMTIATSDLERKLNMMENFKLIVLSIKLKTGVIQRGAGVGKQRADYN